MPKKKLTKKDVVKMLPAKLAKYATISLDKIVSNPLGVIGIIALMHKYAYSAKSPVEYKRIYYRALISGHIQIMLVVSVIHAVARLILYADYKSGRLSKSEYQKHVKSLERALKAQLSSLTIIHFLFNYSSIDDLIKMYMRGVMKMADMPASVIKFVKQINPEKPDISAILKAAKAFKIKAPWLSKLTALLRKLKKSKAAAPKMLTHMA